ncbi:MAG: hypothetical protein L0Y37_06790 [Bacteroidales bacterium]|nr:hypothetical protein [Bacteroidales bacterium]
MMSPREVYQSKEAEFSITADRLRKLSDRLAMARLISFAAGSDDIFQKRNREKTITGCLSLMALASVIPKRRGGLALVVGFANRIN